jgi:hypothetical protein
MIRKAVFRFLIDHPVWVEGISGAVTVLTLVPNVFNVFKTVIPAPPIVVAAVGLVGVMAPMIARRIDAFEADQKTRMDDRIKAADNPDQISLIRGVLQTYVKSIVDSRLYTPLGTRLPLALSLQPSAVDNPLAGAGAPVAGTGQPIPDGTPIRSVYESQLCRMLILGPGGSGKTGVLLELAGQLLLESTQESNAPVPVVFQLSSWPETEALIGDWLVGELHRIYGIDDWLGKRWLDTNLLIPLLDGLDVVGGEAGARCVDAINNFIGDHGVLPIVVTSRLEEYESLGKKLRLRGAVVVQPLTPAQIEDTVAAPDLAGVRDVLAADHELFELMRTPMFLGIVARTYRGKVAAAVPTGGSLQERRDLILTDYVSACLSEPRLDSEPAFAPEQTRIWLGWLAAQMLARRQEVFYYDLMQPDLLPEPGQRRLVTVGVGVIAGVLTGLLAWIGNLNVFGIVFAGFFGVVSGIVVGMAAYEPVIAPTAPIQGSWPQLRRNLSGWLSFGPLFGLLAGLSVGAIAQFRGEKIAWFGIVLSGLFAGLCLGIFFAMVGALESRPYDEPKGPGEAIKSSLRNAIRGGAMMAALSALIAGVGGGLIVALARLPQGAHGDLYYWVVPGLIVQGLAISLLLGVFGFDPGVRIGLGRSWRTSVVIGLGVAIVDAQVAAFMTGHFGGFSRYVGTGPGAVVAGGLIAGALLAILVGVGTGICHGMLRGGGAYLRHRALVYELLRHGYIAPDYLAFLKYASRIRLLQRRGGGYQFIHRFLLEHFGDSTRNPAPVAPKPVGGPVAAGVGQ